MFALARRSPLVHLRRRASLFWTPPFTREEASGLNVVAVLDDRVRVVPVRALTGSQVIEQRAASASSKVTYPSSPARRVHSLSRPAAKASRRAADIQANGFATRPRTGHPLKPFWGGFR